ncbi:hypothetical protein NOCA2310007 [metagenome]|uniref:Uncharacterized protein n=1 Tax=metagenome TaxID=256318 RepID=A0A2P2C1D1_9ZZZZ
MLRTRTGQHFHQSHVDGPAGTLRGTVGEPLSRIPWVVLGGFPVSMSPPPILGHARAATQGL